MLWAYTSHLFTLQWNLGCLCASALWLSSGFLCKKTLVAVSTFMDTVYHIYVHVSLRGFLKGLFTVLTFKRAILAIGFCGRHIQLKLKTEINLLLDRLKVPEWAPFWVPFWAPSQAPFLGSDTGVDSLWDTFIGDFLADSCFSL